VYLLLAAAAYLAYRQVRRGRADQRGALRLAIFTTLLIASSWAASPHVSDMVVEQQRLFLRLGLGMFVGGAMYVLYLGFEPFVRRAWPSILVGWTRLLAGRLRDPIIGRDVLLGIACGAGFSLLHFAAEVLPRTFGFSEPPPHAAEFGVLISVRAYVLTLIGCVNTGLQNSVLTVFEVSALRAGFEGAIRRAPGWKPSPRTSERLFIVVAVLTLTAIALVPGAGSHSWLDSMSQLVSMTIIILLLTRIGILALTVMFVVNYVLLRVPLTLDGRAIYAGTGWFTMVWVIGLAIVAYRLATRPVALADA
jgi:hypothetical protein